MDIAERQALDEVLYNNDNNNDDDKQFAVTAVTETAVTENSGISA